MTNIKVARIILYKGLFFKTLVSFIVHLFWYIRLQSQYFFFIHLIYACLILLKTDLGLVVGVLCQVKNFS